MSQIKFDAKHNDRDVEVITGWDPPLGYFHLTIFLKNPKENEDEVIFSEFDTLGFCRNLKEIENVLIQFNISIPPRTLDLVREKEGSVVYKFDGKGYKRYGI